ncbi:MAG: extracellular catalytic domain type 1 short-chain-length polyhydroxyalkanoate depolymerase [Caulobacteraceae bacterium]
MVEVAAFGPNPGQLKMLLYAPSDLAAGRPLVVVLHGCTQTAEGYARGAGWLTLADRFGFALVCPQQQKANNPNLCFNWFEAGDTRRGAGEAASIRNMVDTAARRLGTDRTQIFVTGLSAGGAMASALLAAYPDVFAGGGIVAGLPYGVAQGMSQAFTVMFQDSAASAEDLGARVRLASAHEGPWPRVSVWHGAADTTVRPSNADAVIAQWAQVHGLDAQPSSSTRIGGRTHDIWTRSGETVLERHVIAGLGHGTPLASEGPHGAGGPGPFLLEAGVSSSLELLRFWKVVPAPRAEARPGQQQASAETSVPAVVITHVRERPVASDSGGPDRTDGSSGIGAIINKALRAAGLM